ncbi:uncharacterized protein TM35_000531020, partial [Trypanosoma theileri]
VLCCVGVAHAADPQRTARMVKKAHEMAKETMKLKEECENVATTAEGAARNATVFAMRSIYYLKQIAANTTEVGMETKKGGELIDSATKAAAEEEEAIDTTITQSEETIVRAATALEEAVKVLNNMAKGKCGGCIGWYGHNEYESNCDRSCQRLGPVTQSGNCSLRC